MTTRSEDAVAQMFVASTHDYILVFTSTGRMYWLKVHAIPEVGSAGRGKPVVNLIQIASGEQVRALLRTREFPDDQYIVISSRCGYIKKTALSAFSRVRANGIIAVQLDDGDDVLDAGISNGDSEIFLATAQGKSIRFKESDVRPMGRSTRGVKAIRMAKNDRLVGMSILKGQGDILTVTENGFGKRTPIGEYRLQGRSGSGIINIRTSKRNGEVVAVRAVNEEDNLLLITRNGKIIRMNVSEISCIGRATQGVRLIDINKDDAVVDAIRTAERNEEEETAVGGTPDPVDGADSPDT
jgi:DNA gyrase subunit A